MWNIRLPRWRSGKESACQWRRHKRHRFDRWVGKILWSRKWQPTPVFLPGKFHGQRSLAGYSPYGHILLDSTEHTRTHILVTGPTKQVTAQWNKSDRERQTLHDLSKGKTLRKSTCPGNFFNVTQLRSCSAGIHPRQASHRVLTISQGQHTIAWRPNFFL